MRAYFFCNSFVCYELLQNITSRQVDSIIYSLHRSKKTGQATNQGRLWLAATIAEGTKYEKKILDKEKYKHLVWQLQVFHDFL